MTFYVYSLRQELLDDVNFDHLISDDLDLGIMFWRDILFVFAHKCHLS